MPPCPAYPSYFRSEPEFGALFRRYRRFDRVGSLRLFILADEGARPSDALR